MRWTIELTFSSSQRKLPKIQEHPFLAKHNFVEMGLNEADANNAILILIY
jgi:hypothetical protein